jgi:hypothetical protein
MNLRCGKNRGDYVWTKIKWSNWFIIYKVMDLYYHDNSINYMFIF